MAAIWKGTIAFGLVSIPIELHPAVREDRPRFRLLHASDKSPVHYERVCERDGKTVPWSDLVKGYEYAKGRYVVLTKDDFRAAAVEKTKRLDIIDFVDGAAIDDRYFDNSYYVVPATGGDRAYAVLREAMRRTGRVGIGKVVLRDTQHLTELSVVGDALVVTMMRFATELVDASRFKFPDGKSVRPQELAMADKLIEALTSKWDASQYRDDYQTNLMRIIHAKTEGKEAKLVAEQPAAAAEVVDLMERLKQSLAGKGGKRAAHPARRRAPARRRRAA
ncbi:MAG TPA: Ku protein [Candidatus Dormibacteraeota bacterium]|nr:Ku protein [Candidatus Dormibacteraeota bacterium]